MTRSILFIALLAAFLTPALRPASADDLQDVEKVARMYLEAGATGDQELFREAFHPSCRLQFVKEGRYTEWSGAEYIGWQKPRSPEGRESRVLSVDVAGSAAMAKVEIVAGDRIFTDYLGMLNIDGRWWIVNKSFHAEATESR